MFVHLVIDTNTARAILSYEYNRKKYIENTASISRRKWFDSILKKKNILNITFYIRRTATITTDNELICLVHQMTDINLQNDEFW